MDLLTKCEHFNHVQIKMLPLGLKCFLFSAKSDLYMVFVFQIPKNHCFLVGILCNMQLLLRLGVIGSNTDVNSHPKKIIRNSYFLKNPQHLFYWKHLFLILNVFAFTLFCLVKFIFLVLII